MRYLSFFTGAMGLDLGLEHAGWTPVAFNEIDPIACQTISRNRPGIPLFAQDIRSLSHAFLRDTLGPDLASIDAVVGGPPCQAFSTAGRRQGLNDERGHVFLHFLDLAIRLEPQYVIIENVRGLLSAPLVHRPHHERGPDFPELTEAEAKGGALKLILSRLEESGYACSFRLYDTSRFGVPQVRERVVLIAARGKRRVPHLLPFTAPAPTVREALRGLDGEPECLPLRSKMLPYLPLLGPGENWRSLPIELQKEALGNVFFCEGGRTGFLRRVAWDSPSPTLVTTPTMPATLLAHPEELRALSVQEYQRLQTFPDNWQLAGRTAEKYRQLGNAVPVKFGEAIGHHVSAWHEGRLLHAESLETSRYRGTDESAFAPAIAV